MDKTEPKRYFDFNYLLEVKLDFSQDERREILQRLSEKKVRGMIEHAVLGAISAGSDKVFDSHKRNDLIVTDQYLDELLKFMRTHGTVGELAKDTNQKMRKLPEIGKIYSHLLDFEIFLAKQGKSA